MTVLMSRVTGIVNYSDCVIVLSSAVGIRFQSVYCIMYVHVYVCVYFHMRAERGIAVSRSTQQMVV